MVLVPRHAKSHIDTSYSNQIVISLVLKAKDNIISCGVHCPEIIKELQSYSINEKSVAELVTYLNSIKMKNIETLYNRMFNDLMKNSDKFFQWPRKAATVLCMKFVEIIISSKNKEEISDEIITKNLNNKEIAGMQYLAGYVMRQVFIKLRCSIKNIAESQQAMIWKRYL